MIQENDIRHFKYSDLLRDMCHRDPILRIQSFADIERRMTGDRFIEIDFSEEELEAYRRFADEVCRHISKVEHRAKYTKDVGRIETQLNHVYQSFMLEQYVPDSVVVLRCLVTGLYYYMKQGLQVQVVRNFIKLLKSLGDEKKRIVLANLHTKLDALPRYSKGLDDDNVPF